MGVGEGMRNAGVLILLCNSLINFKASPWYVKETWIFSWLGHWGGLVDENDTKITILIYCYGVIGDM